MASEPLTFERYWGRSSPMDHDYDYELVAKAAWEDRQPEIDALRERERKLWEYVTHKSDCAALACAVCGRITSGERHTTMNKGMHTIVRFVCTCGLAEILAAKESE